MKRKDIAKWVVGQEVEKAEYTKEGILAIEFKSGRSIIISTQVFAFGEKEK